MPPEDDAQFDFAILSRMKNRDNAEPSVIENKLRDEIKAEYVKLKHDRGDEHKYVAKLNEYLVKIGLKIIEKKGEEFDIQSIGPKPDQARKKGDHSDSLVINTAGSPKALNDTSVGLTELYTKCKEHPQASEVAKLFDKGLKDGLNTPQINILMQNILTFHSGTQITYHDPTGKQFASPAYTMRENGAQGNEWIKNGGYFIITIPGGGTVKWPK